MHCPPTVTGKDGTVKSRIVPTLTNGSIVTDPRASIIISLRSTVWLNLKGLSTWERAEALLALHIPNFREELVQSAQQMHIWRQSISAEFINKTPPFERKRRLFVILRSWD